MHYNCAEKQQTFSEVATQSRLAIWEDVDKESLHAVRRITQQ